MKKNYINWKESIEWYFLNRFVSSFPSQSFRRICLRSMGAVIPKKTPIYGGSEYRRPSRLIIGKGSTIGHRALLDARLGISIGENVTIATEVMIWTMHHDYNDVKFKTVGGEVTVGNFAWLGSRCIILPRVKIGEGAVVAAGAVVTKDVAPYTVVGGIPAKMIAKREKHNYDYIPGNYRLHFV